VQINLDFRENKLILDPLTEVTVLNKRETIAQLDAQIAGLEFEAASFCNGPLEVWNDKDDSLLGRAKGYIPLNMYVDTEGHQKRIERLNTLRRELIERPLTADQLTGPAQA